MSPGAPDLGLMGERQRPRPRVLVVEDEEMLVMLLEDMLPALGCELAEAPGRFEDAMLAAERGAFDMAILDVNLDGKPSYPIADVLRARGIPFVFATGYGALGLLPAYAAEPVLQKPFLLGDLEAAVAGLLPPQNA